MKPSKWAPNREYYTSNNNIVLVEVCLKSDSHASYFHRKGLAEGKKNAEEEFEERKVNVGDRGNIFILLNASAHKI